MSEVSFSDSLNKFKESFLLAAAQGGNTEDCESLLDIGAQVDWRNPDGDTALLAACRRGHTDTVVLLLVYGADGNVKGRDSQTPLHICARNGDLKTLNVLLDAGADASRKTDDNMTPLAIAHQKGFESIVRRLAENVQNEGPDTLSMTSAVANAAARARGQYNVNAVSDVATLSAKGIPAADQRTNSSSRLLRIPQSSAHDGTRGDNHNNTKDSKKNIQIAPRSYSLIGKETSPTGDFCGDEQYIALCRQLDIENKNKKVLEGQVESLRKQLQELDISITRLHHQMAESDSKTASQKLELDKLKGVGIEALSMKECEDLERTLKLTLDAIALRKEKIVKEEMGQQNEQRLCVICQIEEKSVVLFPCRHMCLCEGCAHHEDLESCPLCRRIIIQRVSVFK